MSLQHGIRDHNELRNSVSARFCTHLGDAYIVVSENSRDIRQSARLVRNLKAEEISRSPSPRSVLPDNSYCNAAVPSTVVMDDISHDNDDITHDSAGRRHLSPPRPMNIASSQASPWTNTALNESRTVASGCCPDQHRVNL